MSATDSDNSIDWLASDNEENDSEQEPDCASKNAQAEAAPSPSSPPYPGLSDGSRPKEGGGNWSEVSSWGSPRRMEKIDRDAVVVGLGKTQRGEKVTGKSSQPVKRPHSSAEEHSQRWQLVSSEKDQIFSSKVSTPHPPVTNVCFPAGANIISETRTCPITQIASPADFQPFPVKMTLPSSYWRTAGSCFYGEIESLQTMSRASCCF